jgi:hypothetical protein
LKPQEYPDSKKAKGHLAPERKKVLISAPARGIKTIVMGVKTMNTMRKNTISFQNILYYKLSSPVVHVLLKKLRNRDPDDDNHSFLAGYSENIGRSFEEDCIG